MPRSERLLKLLQLLRRQRFAIPAEQLAEMLAVSVRTVYRDIDALRARFGRSPSAILTKSVWWRHGASCVVHFVISAPTALPNSSSAMKKPPTLPPICWHAGTHKPVSRRKTSKPQHNDA